MLNKPEYEMSDLPAKPQGDFCIWIVLCIIGGICLKANVKNDTITGNTKI